MRSHILNLVVLLIAFMAFDLQLPSYDKVQTQNHKLTKVPELDIDPLTNPATRENHKQQNYIAEPFIPIVVLAHSLYETQDFSFYLPLHKLHEPRRFFLLI